ncbi:MAG: selenocysteine-specific translation elongation factor [Gemmatimonadetes bacterium]|nr:selenocysteine-specific translation elongation factor [Gemmatimonadota bacterium]
MSEKRGVVIGTAGHVDHGKTSLVRALTGVETDRWREERERGLTIDIGFAPLDLDDDVEIGVVDVPGHEDFLKNMLAGATGIDALLLVIAADEGPMPQTREHLAIARLLDVDRGVVALTKVDNVEEEWLELAMEATRELLAETPATAEWSVVPVSAKTGAGLEALRVALGDAIGSARSKRVEDLFRLPVDRAFSIRGTGTVVTGTVWSGSVTTGDTVRVYPGDRAARVRGLQVHDQTRSAVAAGRRCALALVGLAADEVTRGSVIVKESGWRETSRLGVRLAALAGTPRMIEHGQRVRVYVGTREAMARVGTVGREPQAPGTEAWALLDLETPMVVRVGDRAILRFYSPVRTIGGARIAELDPPARWTERGSAWRDILSGDPVRAIEASVSLGGLRGIPSGDLPLTSGRALNEIASIGDADVERIGARWFPRSAAREAGEAVVAAMEQLHAADRRAAGVSKEALRSALGETCAPELVERAIGEALDHGVVIENGPRLSLPGHRPELTESEVAARDALVETIRGAGLQPPTVGELAKRHRLARPVLDDLLRLLQDDATTRAVTPELHVSVDALDELATRVGVLLADGRPAAPIAFKDEFGLSRKYLIPLLEYLDREGVTRRTGEGRVLVRSGQST